MFKEINEKDGKFPHRSETDQKKKKKKNQPEIPELNNEITHFKYPRDRFNITLDIDEDRINEQEDRKIKYMRDWSHPYRSPTTPHDLPTGIQGSF